MNTFHEINIMTSRGDVNGAFSLIRYRSESVARKIMKKAGYSIPVHTGRGYRRRCQHQPASAVVATRCVRRESLFTGDTARKRRMTMKLMRR